MCVSPQRRTIIGHRTVQKCSRRLQFFNIFTSKCAFRHSGVQFFRRVKSKKCFGPDVFCTFSLANVLFATGAYNFSTSERTKVVQTRHVLCIFTSECAFHHSGVHFFDIWTYKSAPNTSCFVHFDFRMCFSPQRRAIFAFFADRMTPHPPL